MTEDHKIVLAGCTPTPLGSYLKALGVIRILSEQFRALAPIHAYWRYDHLVLRSPALTGDLTNDQGIVSDFFANKYEPSPLVTPWNGRGGFLEGDDDGDDGGSTRVGPAMVTDFSSNQNHRRFSTIAGTLTFLTEVDVLKQLNSARTILKTLRAEEKRRGKNNLTAVEQQEIKRQDFLVRRLKNGLLQELRGNLPDGLLDWFDTCQLLVPDMTKSGGNTLVSLPSPILGAGGLDGSMDFGVNFLRRVKELFDLTSGRPRNGMEELLRNSLFGTATNRLYSTSPQDKRPVSAGQFNPGQAGGKNASTGYSGDALINPWDAVLQLEGAVVYSGTTTRKNTDAFSIYGSLPFTVAPSAVGHSTDLADESPKRVKRKTAEVWLPIWERPTSYSELKQLFKEGRVTLQGRAVRDGFGFARAVTTLGVNRGITGFQRIAFLKRSGDAFFAVPLGRHSTQYNPASEWLADLDNNQFLDRFRKYVRRKSPGGDWVAPVALRSSAKLLDTEILRWCAATSPNGAQRIIVLLGQINAQLARRLQKSSKKDLQISPPPVPRLREQWVRVADDDGPAFRIARALAGLRGVGDQALPLRAQLFPVHPRYNNWIESACKGDDPSCRERLHRSGKGELISTLISLLHDRLSIAQRLEFKDKPLQSPSGISLTDLATFLEGDHLDAKIAVLLPGLALCDIPRDHEHVVGEGAPPAAFALCKLVLTPDTTLHSLGVLPSNQRLPMPLQLVPKLATGNRAQADQAIQISWRRLRASSLTPAMPLDDRPDLAGIYPRRLAAGLLIPLSYGATGALARAVLKSSTSSEDAA